MEPILTQKIRRMGAQCKIKRALATPLSIAEKYKLNAERNYKKRKKCAYQLRLDFLLDKVENTQSKKAQRELKTII